MNSMKRKAFRESLHHGNLGFDVMACAAIGGATVSLYFFLLDVIAGKAFYTPMLLGRVLFDGAVASEVSVRPLDIGIIAAYTLVHFAAFAVVGLAASLLAHLADFSDDRHGVVAVGVLAIEVASFSVGAIVFPGAIAALGVARIAVANLLAAVTMTVYLVHYRHKLEWHAAR